MYQDEISQLNRIRNESQNKYTYYLISISTSAIGFSLLSLKSESLSWYLLILAFSIISWLVSTLLGLFYNRDKITFFSTNINFLEFKAASNPDELIVNEDEWNNSFF